MDVVLRNVRTALVDVNNFDRPDGRSPGSSMASMVDYPQAGTRIAYSQTCAAAGVSEDFLRAMPKTDLHVHLDGSLRVSTLIELAAEAPDVAESMSERRVEEIPLSCRRASRCRRRRRRSCGRRSSGRNTPTSTSTSPASCTPQR